MVNSIDAWLIHTSRSWIASLEPCVNMTTSVSVTTATLKDYATQRLESKTKLRESTLKFLVRRTNIATQAFSALNRSRFLHIYTIALPLMGCARCKGKMASSVSTILDVRTISAARMEFALNTEAWMI